MSPSDPPLGLPVDMVLLPYAFCPELPNVVAVMTGTVNVFELGLK